MATRRSNQKTVSKTKETIQVSPTLAELLSLSNNSTSQNVEKPSLASTLTDPAIAGARKNKNTVTLGFDPDMAKTVAETAVVASSLVKLQNQLDESKKTIRAYGTSKRSIYNDKFVSDVTTVDIPYLDNQETKFVQVICANRYSVSKETVLSIESRLGESFSRLFNKSESKTLKPNAELLFKKILIEVGVPSDKLDITMSGLFDTDTSVSTTDSYEREIKKVTGDLADILNQAVVRAEPGIKFPTK